MTGRVRWFDARKGYGFVTLDDDPERDVFVHYSGWLNPPRRPLPGDPIEDLEGVHVEFDIEPGPKGPQCCNLRIIEQETAN